MESAAGYLPAANVTLAYFIMHLYMQWEGWWICLTLYVSLLQFGLTAVYWASFFGHLEVVEFLIESGTQVNSVHNCNVMECPANMHDLKNNVNTKPPHWYQ